MKSGNAQNDSVSGEAKLSCTRATVRSVGRLDRGRRFRHLVRPNDARVLQLPCAGAERRLARLDAGEQPVAAVQTEHADLRRGQPLAVQLHAVRMDDGDTLRRQARDRTAAARAGRRSAPAGRRRTSDRRCPAPRRARTSPTTAGSPRTWRARRAASAQSVGAARNSQADTPAARATISSDERVRRQKHSMPPSSTANGRICIAI